MEQGGRLNIRKSIAPSVRGKALGNSMEKMSDVKH